MEPIASSGAGASIRPASSTSAELSALLKDGRVLRAEVLAPNTGGSLLLAIARHTIPAESELQLDPGARLLVRVEEGADGVVLRALAPDTGGEDALVAALRALVGRTPLGEELGELGRALQGESALTLGPELAPLASELATRLTGPALGDASGGESLRVWLAALGLGHEAGLAASLAARPDRSLLEELRGSLKALLLRADSLLGRREGEHVVLREGVARALLGIEAEQLLNAARERAGEPTVLAFPFFDGEAWTTARLLVPRRDGREDASEPAVPGSARVTLGLELSRIGPVRADLTLGPGALSVNLLVTRAPVARRIEDGLAALGPRLGDGRRALAIRVRLGTPAEARRGFLPQDIRYLREHHLMNVAG